jgi:multiple sugar transport system ATP-binding protein
VFFGRIFGNSLYIGDDAVLAVRGAADQEVYACVRPEGFEIDKRGALRCGFNRVEVMGRDVSVIASHSACADAAVRAIVDAGEALDARSRLVRFSLKPQKVHLFSRESEGRIDFECGEGTKG